MSRDDLILLHCKIAIISSSQNFPKKFILVTGSIMRHAISSIITLIKAEIHRRKCGLLFDEADYLEHHPDVRNAVKAGAFESAEEHFKRYGHHEGRFPGFNGFDPDRYLIKNPDIQILTTDGDRREFAKLHFRWVGFAEKRPF